MSFPSDNLSGSPLPPDGIPASPPRRHFGLRWTSWVILLVLVGSCVVPQAPREIGRWKLASALNARDAGRKEEAYASLEAAEKWFPENSLLLLQRAEWRLEDGQRQPALEDCDRAFELSGESVSALLWHSQFLQTAGLFGDAVKDWKKLNQMSERSGRPNRASALNGLAYAQALAQVELDEALDHVNEAIELVPGNVPGNAAMLDTRGYLLYLNEHYEAALADMNIAVRDYESDFPPSGADEQLSTSQHRLLDSHPKCIRDAISPNRARGLAVVRYHRALLLRALGREKEAEEDLARARQLIGREPDATLF